MLQPGEGGEAGGEDAAFAHSLLLLARREYCREELRSRLIAKGFDPAATEQALDRLVARGYLSEARYAKAYLSSRIRRGDTPRLAAMKARQRGVDEAVLTEAQRELESGFDNEQACSELLEKRDPSGLRFLDSKQWRKQARYLRSKGFDAGTIIRVMRSGRRTEDA